MTNVFLALALSTIAAGGGSKPLTFEVDYVNRHEGAVDAGLAIEPAPGGDHYELLQVGGNESYPEILVFRADKDYRHRWSVPIEPSETTRRFRRVVASGTDTNGDLVFMTFDESFAYGSGCDVRLHKISQDGNVAYDKRIAHTGCDTTFYVKLEMLPAGRVLVAGVGSSRGYLHRYSADGTEELDKDLYQDTILQLATDPGGRVFAVMQVDKQYVLRELDDDGEPLWSRSVNPGPLYTPRHVDLTVNGVGRVVLTTQFQAPGQAGRISVAQYAKDGVGAPLYYTTSTRNSINWSSGYRVYVAHDPKGAVYLAWTKDKDAVATVAKVVPQPPAPKGTSTLKAGIVKNKIVKGTNAKATALDTLWSKDIAIGQLRGLARMGHGGVVVFGAGAPSGATDPMIEARALDHKGRSIGSETLPGASDPQAEGAPPHAQLNDWYVQGSRVFAIGRAYDSSNPQGTDGAQKMRLWFGKKSTGPKPSSTKPSSTGSSSSTGASSPKPSGTPLSSKPSASKTKSSAKSKPTKSAK